MSQFGKLFRDSRIARMPPPIEFPSASSVPPHPTCQLITTSPANRARRDWGLKVALPSRAKSKYISYDKLDTRYGFMTYEIESDNFWALKKFQNLNIPLEGLRRDLSNHNKENENLNKQQKKSQYNQLPKISNPLFIGNTDDSRRVDMHYSKDRELSNSLLGVLGLPRSLSNEQYNKEIEKLKKISPRFRKWVLNEKKIDIFTDKSTILKDFAIEFLSILNSKDIANQKLSSNISKITRTEDKKCKVSGTGGLGYTLRGRLTNSPNGSIRQNIIEGRILKSGGSSQYTVGIGGFITNVSSNNLIDRSSNSNSKKPKVKIVVDSGSMGRDGGVSMNIGHITKPDTSRNLKKSIGTTSKPINQTQRAFDYESILKILS